MASTTGFTRAHLIYAICLPLAILVGYFLADSQDSASLGVVMMVLCLLATPVLMRWHHPLLVFSCNAVICLAFLPGTPPLWMLMTVISMFFLVLNRCLGQPIPFFQVPSISYPLVALAVVAIVTAEVTGGIGFRALGASSFGGRKYFSLLAGIAVFFAVSVQPIRRERARLYTAIFFLSGLTALAGYVALLAGPAFYTAFMQFFPIQGTVQEAFAVSAGLSGPEFARWGEAGGVSFALYCWLLSRYGVEGLFNLKKPWRLGLLALSFVAALISGFRSSLILLLVTFGLMIYLEGLMRTRLFLAMCFVGLLGAAIAIPNIQRLPPAVQRSLAFLPLDVDPMVRQSAEGSTQWRLDMWQELLPQLPHHLIKGIGYGMNPDELYMTSVDAYLGIISGSATSAVSGDYHSGPLSVILPFGLPGVVAFVWFLVASVKALRRNYLYGDPDLKIINRFLYAFFLVRIINFLFVFGSLYSDISLFAAIIGLSISLNGGVRTPPEKTDAETTEEEEEFLSAGRVAAEI